MKKAALIHALEEGRKEFLQSIEGLDAKVMTQPGVVGEWSIKDILAHLNMWEAETVKFLYQAREGSKPTTIHFKKVNPDEQNAEWLAEMEDRPLDLIRKDFDAIRKQTIRRVSEFNDKELDQKGAFDWLKKNSISEVVLSDTVEHEAEHAAEIQKWRENTKGS